MMEEDFEEEERGHATPAWVVTFADLMALLMCFFVLILSFSELDTRKFKKLLDSVNKAFSVQNEVVVYQLPSGVSNLDPQFSHQKAAPTLLDIVQQQTVDMQQQYAGQSRGDSYKQLQQDARTISQILDEDIARGDVEVETKDGKIVIRISEKASFASGSDDLSPDFLPSLEKFGVLSTIFLGPLLLQAIRTMFLLQRLGFVRIGIFPLRVRRPLGVSL